MKKLELYNTLTRDKSIFEPLAEVVGIYSCGPTVYDFATIGNLRAYVFADILRKTLLFNGYKVKQVINITDVGHLVSDADDGQDKLEKGSLRENLSVWQIAEKYTKAFQDDLKKLNIQEPDVWTKATDYIEQQINFIKKLEDNDLTYKTSDGIYFDTSSYSGYTELAKLNLAGQQEGARVETNSEKKNPTDFALWKFSPQHEKRQMEWDSPWGVGFPGWHIECSAMSTEIFGSPFDIHTGGVDHLPVHHTNERAQNWGVYHEETVARWMHNEFLQVDNGKMGKSLGNAYTLADLVAKGFQPPEFRYFLLQAHYRSKINFTWEALQSAKNGYENLVKQIKILPQATVANQEFLVKFTEAINDDLNTARCLALIFEVLSSDLEGGIKRATLIEFDKVLSLDLNQTEEALEIPDQVKKLLLERQAARANKDWAKSDTLRQEIAELGFQVKDGADGEQEVTN